MSTRLILTAAVLAGIATGILRAPNWVLDGQEATPKTGRQAGLKPTRALYVPPSGIVYGHLTGSWSSGLYCPPNHRISVQLQSSTIQIAADFTRYEISLVDGEYAWRSYREVLRDFATATGRRQIDISATSMSTASQLWRAVSDAQRVGLEPELTLPGWEGARFSNEGDPFALRGFGYGGVAFLGLKGGLIVGG